ncbi:major facilitator superfamily domain-containing protein [Xylaria telfairii]|nr:major facilitator superfamily domain-containing protein [Xylaria telfairii]
MSASSPRQLESPGSSSRETAISLDDDDQQTREREYITGLPFALVMLSILLVTFLGYLDTSIISTALPHITDDFHSLSDCYMFFFGLFELGSLICGVATSNRVLIIGRGVESAGSSDIANGCFTILANSVPLERRVIWTGLLLGFLQLGIYSTWRWCFYINLPVGSVPALVKKTSIELRQLYGKLDLIGFVLFTPVPVQLLLALHYGQVGGWGTSISVGLFFICTVATLTSTFGGTILATGSGLLSMLNPTSPMVEWIDFQVLCGVERGLGAQMALVAMQSNLAPSEISCAMSLFIFAQTLSFLIFLTVSNTILDQSLESELGTLMELIISIGATKFRSVVSPQELDQVIKAYVVGLDSILYLVAALGAASVLTAQGMGWVDVRKNKTSGPADRIPGMKSQ